MSYTEIVKVIQDLNNRLGSLSPNGGTLRIQDANNFTPIPKGTVYNAGTWLYQGTADLFAGSLTPTNPPSLFRVQVCLKEANTFVQVRAPAGAASLISEAFYEGYSLVAGAAYFFDSVISVGDKTNYRLGNAGTVLYVSVTEIPMAK